MDLSAFLSPMLLGQDFDGINGFLGTRAALIVDSIEDQRQVVIKGLQESYGHVPGIAAATILGDGQIALILDPTDVIQQAALSRSTIDLKTNIGLKA